MLKNNNNNTMSFTESNLVAWLKLKRLITLKVDEDIMYLLEDSKASEDDVAVDTKSPSP